MRWLIAAAWCLFACSCLGGEAGGESIRFSAEPDQELYELGQPVRIRLKFQNQGQENVAVFLGMSDMSGFSLTWKPLDGEGKAIAVQLKEAAGITFPIIVKVPAGGTGTYEFLLNRLLRPDRPGTFELTVQIMKPKLRGITDIELPPAKTTIKLLPPLNKRLEEWYAAAFESGGRKPEDQARAIENIVYTRSPLALIYQDRILAKSQPGVHLSLEEVQACVDSMLCEEQEELAMPLLAKRLEDANTDRSVRMMILYAIKSYGWDKLKDSSKKLLAPYRQEIEKAVGVSVSD